MELGKSIILLLAVSSLLLFSVESTARTISVRSDKSNIPSDQELKQQASSARVDPAIKQICAKTSNFAECVVSILPYLNGATDPISVLKMEIHALRKRAQEAITKAAQLGKDPANSAIVSGCLSTCQMSYQSSVDSLDSALTAISNRDIGKLNSELSASLTYISDCETAYGERKLVSPFGTFIRFMEKLASNNLAIGKLVQL